MIRKQASLASMKGLDIAQLETIAGGVATWGSGPDDPKKSESERIGGACADMAANAIPQAETPHATGAGASASSGGGQAQASASAQIGYSEQQNMGGVTVTTYAGLSAQAEAKAGPLGAQAGASVTGGFGNHFDLGKGVEIVTEAKGFAGLGVAAGFIDNHVAAGGAAAAGFSSGISQKFTSAEFGDGAKVTQTATVEAGGKAQAGGGVQFGQDGVKGGYDTSAGFYAKAEAGVAVGNDSYSGGASARAISPGSVSVGSNVGADFEDGQLKLTLSAEMAAVFGGIGFELKAGVRMLDSEETKGSPEEIKEAFGELMQHLATEDEQLTDQWQRQLESDISMYKDMMRPLEQDLQSAQNELSRFTEERGRIQERLTSFNTAAMLHDYQQHMGAEEGERYWKRDLQREQDHLKEFDERNGPKIATMQERIATYGAQVEERRSVLSSMQAELAVARKGDADNIRHLEDEQKKAVSDLNAFIRENEPRMLNAQSQLERIQENRDDISSKIIALEILSGVKGAYSGTAEFRAQVAEDLKYIKEHVDPSRISRDLADFRQDLARFDKEHGPEVKELQERVNVLGREFVASMQELKSLQAELAEARNSTFMAQRAQAEMELRDERDTAQRLEMEEKRLGTEVNQLQRKVDEESARFARLTEDMQRREQERPFMEERKAQELARFQSDATRFNDTRALDEIARFKEFQASGKPVTREVMDSFRMGQIQDQVIFLRDYERDKVFLDERRQELEGMKAQLQEKVSSLTETRSHLGQANEALAQATREAYAHHPEHAARMRAEAMEARTNAMKAAADAATGDNRDILRRQFQLQEQLQHSLNINAEVSGNMLKEAQTRFDQKYHELQNKYDDLKQVELKRGVLGYVAQGARDVASSFASLF